MTAPLAPEPSSEPRSPTPTTDTGAPRYPVAIDALPTVEQASGGYVLRFARTPEELLAILKLRFEVFNLELNEGLAESFRTGRDEDDLDERFHHLAITHKPSGEMVGTYRMQTSDMAAVQGGFYSAGEFDLSGIPREILADAVEIGRACVAKAHRNGRVLQLLWRGLAQYLQWNHKRYLFGCCSLTSQDQDLGYRVQQFLAANGHVHPDCRVAPLDGLECHADPDPAGPASEVHIPALFQSYLNLGALVCGPPAIDRSFQTIDYLVLLDTLALDQRVYRVYFG